MHPGDDHYWRRADCMVVKDCVEKERRRYR